MYHEETVIDGILCHRTTPDGDWIPYTLEAMTTALRAERTLNEEHRTLWLDADAKLLEIRAVLSRGD